MCLNGSKLFIVLFIVVLLTGCRSAPSGAPDDPHAKPGFVTLEEDGRLWVLRPGEKPAEKHITLVGAGPDGMTLKALDKDTALAYIATVPGFEVEIEDGRIWVLKPGEEKSEKHITLVGAGPMNMTIKALSKETAQEYIACLGSDES